MHAPQEMLMLMSCKMTKISYFSTYFASSKGSKRATKLHEKGHFTRDFEKWGTYLLCPQVPTSMIELYVLMGATTMRSDWKY